MLEQLQSALSWVPWLAGAGGIALAAAAYFMGLDKFIQALGKAFGVVVDAVAPLVKLASDVLADSVRWVAYNILGPGLMKIMTDTPILLTVAAMGYGLWFVIDRERDAIDRKNEAVIVELKTAMKKNSKAASDRCQEVVKREVGRAVAQMRRAVK
jgi:hypothetical protein